MKDAEQPKFIHLRCHSEYSVTDGIVKLEEYLNQALEVDMPALALTDLSNLFGAVKFYKKAIDKKIKPIIGCDVWLQNEQFVKAFDAEVLFLSYDNATSLTEFPEQIT